MTAKRQSRTRAFAGDLERITLTRRDWAGVTPANSASHLQTCSRCPEYTSSDETPPRSFHSRCSAPRSAFKRPPFQEALSKKRRRALPLFIKGTTPPEISKRTSKDLQEALCSVFFFHPETFSLFFQTHSLLLFQALMSLHSFHSRTPTADCSVSFGAALGDPSSFSTDSASALFPCSPQPHHNFLRFSPLPLPLPCLFTASVQLIRSDCRFSLIWG